MSLWLTGDWRHQMWSVSVSSVTPEIKGDVLPPALSWNSDCLSHNLHNISDI